MLLDWTPITSHATVPRANAHLRAFVLLTAGDLGDFGDDDFLRIPLSFDGALLVAGAIGRTLQVGGGPRGLFARGIDVSSRWRRCGTTRSILTFFLSCLRAGAGLSVMLEAAASGVERGAAAVVAVAAASEAPVGLALSAGVRSSSGCFCVRVQGRQLPSASSGLVAAALEAERNLHFGWDAPGSNFSPPSWPASWA